LFLRTDFFFLSFTQIHGSKQWTVHAPTRGNFTLKPPITPLICIPIPSDESYTQHPCHLRQRCRCCRFWRRRALRTGATVPPDPRSLAQAPPRISSFCVCARVLFVYEPSVKRSFCERTSFFSWTQIHGSKRWTVHAPTRGNFTLKQLQRGKRGEVLSPSDGRFMTSPVLSATLTPVWLCIHISVYIYIYLYVTRSKNKEQYGITNTSVYRTDNNVYLYTALSLSDKSFVSSRAERNPHTGTISKYIYLYIYIYLYVTRSKYNEQSGTTYRCVYIIDNYVYLYTALSPSDGRFMTSPVLSATLTPVR